MLSDIFFKEQNDTTRRLTLASILHGIYFKISMHVSSLKRFRCRYVAASVP